MQLHYNINFDNVCNSYIQIELIISDISEQQLELKMPVWIPGSYMIREFSKNIDYIIDLDTNTRLKKTAKNTWILNTADRKNCRLQYSVYGYDWSVRTNHITQQHAFLNGAAAFLYIEQYKHLPVTLKFSKKPEWQSVSSNLPTLNDNEWERQAAHFDELYDSVFEFGNQAIYQFKVQQTNYTLAVFGENNADFNQVISDLKKIIEQQILIFGKQPCNDYLFIIQHSEFGFGGLEHCFSSVNQIPRNHYTAGKLYQQAISLLAHEHFHLWNVKRIKPAAFIPFNYEVENYTELLWFFEGITSFYDDFTCFRAGVFSLEDYFIILEELLNIVQNNAGNDTQSLSESSFDAWIKYYRPNENTGNAQVSYYKKGAVVALLINFIIQHYSDLKYSLDDIMRDCFEDSLADNYKGITTSIILQKLEKYATFPWNQFFDDYIFGTKPLPVVEIFNLRGFDISENIKNEKTLGIKSKKQDNGYLITYIDKRNTAINQDFQVGDIIQKINNETISVPIDEFIQKFDENFLLSIDILRDGLPQNIKTTVVASTELVYKINGLIDI